VILDDALAPDPRVDVAAGGLRALGVQRGDVVSWKLPNSEDAALLYRACWRLGAIAAPVHHLGDATPLGLFVDGPPTGDPVVESAAQPDDVAVYLGTSGSSGAPKLVCHTHRALAYKTRLMIGVHGLTPDDAVLMPAPLAHISGLLNGVLVAGATPFRSVFMAKWDPAAAAEIIERERITFMVGPPTFFIDVMQTGQARNTLRLISSGGAGVTPAFVEDASERLGAVVKRTYGSTEAPTVTTSTPTDPFERARDTDGRSTGAARLRISDPATGQEQPVGESGELWLRGPELFVGYADAEQTRAVIEKGWFRTGDLATVDADGWVTIVGRIKDIIIRGGENIAAAEVESVLERHPDVLHAVAVGYPDERLGERVCAPTPWQMDTSIGGWQYQRSLFEKHRYKTPEKVIQVEDVPAIGPGKPDRAALRARAAAD